MSNIDNNQNQNENNTRSVILNLENISTEYNNVLTQYNQARSNYINYLNTMTETQNASADPQYIILTNTFYGQNTLVNPTQTNNIASCKNQCSANSSCTGANFVNGSSCLLMKDVNGQLSAKQESSAIVPPEIYYLTTLKQLNQQLMNLNTQLTQQINTGQPIYENQLQERQNQSEVLDKNYKSLVSERDKIELQINEIDNINEAQTNSTLIVNKNYAIYKYLIFALLVIVLIFLSLPLSVSNQITGQAGGKIINNEYKHLICGFIILILVIFYFYFY
jgi:hypothetical protein